MARRRGDVYDRPVREVRILKRVVVVVGLARGYARVHDDIVAEHIVVREARRVELAGAVLWVQDTPYFHQYRASKSGQTENCVNRHVL